MNLSQGRFLTPEQSIRMTIVDSCTRQALIEHIALFLRRAAKSESKGVEQHNTPKRWYSKAVRAK